MPWRNTISEPSEVKNAYEPLYQSKQQAWKNHLDYSKEDLESMQKDFELVLHMFEQFLEEFRRRGIDEKLVRQVVVEWIYSTSRIDQEWHDFDKKVGVDSSAVFRELEGD
jgi:Asp-tRNA(Asn)/Glu-tRNA(Gln) amidotransferase C subunit